MIEIVMEKVQIGPKGRQLSDNWKIEYEPFEVVRIEADEDGNEIGYNINGTEVSFISAELTDLLIEQINKTRERLNNDNICQNYM